MKLRLFFIGLFFLIDIHISLTAQAQTRYLSVGDKIPNVEFKMINYHRPKIKLSDFSGKPMILDFWSTWCTVCIKQFPKLEALQKKFKDRLGILLITAYKDSAYNKKFFDEMERRQKKVHLPSIVEDTSLLRLLAASGLPIEVWVDANGIIKAITDHTAVTEENINRFISGQELNLPFIGYKNKNYNTSAPLLLYGNGGPDSVFLSRSLFTAYQHGLKNTRDHLRVMDDSGRFTRITLINQSLFQFYKIISYKNYGADDFLSDAYTKRLVINGKFASVYRDWPMLSILSYDTVYKFMLENLFCYELILPSRFSESEAFIQMEKDVNFFFKTKLSIEKRKVRCLSLICNSPQHTVLNRPKQWEKEMANVREMFYYNVPISRFVNHLNEFIRIPFVIDRTGISSPISIEISLPANYLLADIRAQLKKYGLDLVEVESELNVMVLSDLPI